MSGSANSTAPSSNSSANQGIAPSERVVLKVGDVQVTQAQFETMVKDLEEQQGPADLSRKAIGENYSSMLMLSQRAVAQHLDSSPEVVRQLALDRTQILSNAEFARLKAKVQPTPAEIQAYYDAHLADYDTVDLRRVFIWEKTADIKDGKGVSPQEAKALAAAIRKAYASGGDAKKIVPDSHDAVLDSEPTIFQRGEMPARMEQAVFALKEGEWAELDDSPGNLLLLQAVKLGRRDLKEVSPQIEKKLQAQKLKAELEDVKKEAGVWMDEAYFAPAPKTSVSSTQPRTSAPEKH